MSPNLPLVKSDCLRDLMANKKLGSQKCQNYFQNVIPMQCWRFPKMQIELFTNLKWMKLLAQPKLKELMTANSVSLTHSLK